MSTVLILGGAAPAGAGHGRDLSLRALTQFKARGSRIVVTDTAEALAAAPEYAFLADETHAVDYTDPEACVAWALAYAERHPVDAVTGFREYSVVAVAEVAAALGLAGNRPELVRTVRTKDLCRLALNDLGFRQPAVSLCSSTADIEDFLARHGGPAVVKPRDAAGSEGVVRVDGPGEAAAALALAGGGGDSGPVLVEEFVTGPEFSVEGVFAGGTPYALAVTGKILAPGTFVEAGHVTPVELADGRHEEITHEATRALKALGLTHGIFHVECWLTAEGPVLGEVHVRPGGDWLHAMVEWAHPGLELLGCLHDDLLGLAVSLPGRPVRGAAVRFVLPEAGVVTAIDGWETVAAHDGLIHAELALAPGDTVVTAASSGDRVGTVCLGAESTRAAADRVEALLAGLRVRTVRIGGWDDDTDRPAEDFEEEDKR
ncbi:ATP-grasp domain-containing protein [Streptomyces vietnamensis]|uniref:ATP-grasp domain-containing protein n=1 Tax=Streptomyces vietnamensis TaxID=362257 RepID=UPI000ADECD8E|nr:ATP-grasp domain-containing protein [Streptomyces vietnamensis]